MKYRLVLERLLEIERAIGIQDAPAIKRMVVEAQELILKLQKNLSKLCIRTGTQVPYQSRANR